MRFTPFVTRRAMLQQTIGGFGFLALAGLLNQAKASTRPTHFVPRAKRVILLFMQGGVSHLDTFDYKPRLNRDHGRPFGEQQAKILGCPWRFRQHGASGQWISELLPHLSEHADDLCVLTTLHTDQQAHQTAVPMFHTGSALQVRPSLGAWVVYGLGAESDELPGFLAMNPLRNIGGQNHGNAFLPAEFQATMVQPSGGGGQAPVPNIRPQHVSTEQQALQMDLLRKLHHERHAQDGVNGELDGVIQSYEMAFRMQFALPSRMDLSRESAATLKQYGVNEAETDDFARQCLYARKFAEAGVRFIEIGQQGWDHHQDLKTRLPASARRVDRPIAALLADLKQRDMLRDTLVIWAGEFGRTPYAQFDNGRDHNNRAFTIWLAGGGVKAGFRHGTTDDLGHEGLAGRVHIHDLHATILHLLGLDHERLTYRYSGRDFRLTDVQGNVVQELLA